MLGELETGNVKRDGEKFGLFDLKKNIKRDLILPNSSLPFQSDLGTQRIDIQTWSQSGVSSIPVSFANIEKGKAEVILWRTITLKILWTLIQLVKPLCHGSSTVLHQGFGVQSYGVGGQKEMPPGAAGGHPDPGVIWTHSLLIWSQTRCHCATRSGVGHSLLKYHPEIWVIFGGMGILFYWAEEWHHCCLPCLAKQNILDI